MKQSALFVGSAVLLVVVGFQFAQMTKESEELLDIGTFDEGVNQPEPKREFTRVPRPLALPRTRAVSIDRKTSGSIVCILRMLNGTTLPGFDVKIGRIRAGQDKVAWFEVVQTSDAAGRVEFHGLVTGRYRLVADFIENKISKSVTVRTSEQKHLIIESVWNAVLLWGKVTDAHGRPIPNRAIYVQGRDNEGVACWAERRTSDLGIYRFMMRRGRYNILLSGGPSDHLMSRSNIQFYGAGATGPHAISEELDLRNAPPVVRRPIQAPGTSVNILVTDAITSIPLKGARIICFPFGDKPRHWSGKACSTTTNELGRAILTDLPFGKWSVELDSPGRARHPTLEFELSPSSPKFESPCALAKSGTLRLRLRNPDGSAGTFERGKFPVVEVSTTRQKIFGSEPPQKGWAPPQELVFDDLPAGHCELLIPKGFTVKNEIAPFLIEVGMVLKLTIDLPER